MHDDVHIVDQHPLEVVISLMPVRTFRTSFFYLHLHLIGDRADLRRAPRLTDDEKISHSLVYLSQVQQHDVTAFFIPDGSQNGFYKRGISGQPHRSAGSWVGFFPSGQYKRLSDPWEAGGTGAPDLAAALFFQGLFQKAGYRSAKPVYFVKNSD
ncbi:MAG: hypothetical protein RJA57_1875 [Bacteroidota bacterium]